MAELPRNFPVTAATPAADDYSQLDGATNGSRKFLASQWAFKASPVFTGTPTAPTPNGASAKALVTVDYLPTAMGVAAVRDAAFSALMQLLYPVGEIYITHRSGNPSTLLGFGTWVAYGAGRMLVGLDAGGDADFDAIDDAGGAKTHTLAEANIPAHTHGYGTIGATASNAGSHQHFTFADAVLGDTTPVSASNYPAKGVGAGSGLSEDRYLIGGIGTTPTLGLSSTVADHTHTITLSGSTGSWGGTPTAVSNMNPFITVAMWRRTA